MVTNAPLVWFRILFGSLMLLECWGALATGWVHETFVAPRHTFPLRGFEFLRVLAGPQAYGYFAAMGLAALGVALGWRYRLSAAALAIGWAGAYLGQKSHYNNHYYLAAVVAWCMVFLPAHLDRSLDVRAGRVERARACPAWIARAFRLQLGIVFTYAAIAKLDPGWMSGDYLRVNLGSKGDRPVLGPLLVDERFQLAVRYGALAFDALVIPALCWRRTRLAASLGLLGFNLFNSAVFLIGIFPYMVIGWLVFFYEDRFAAPTDEGRAEARTLPGLRAAAAVLLVVQAVLPLRHHLIEGDVTWTEEGHRMSWRMMLRTKTGTLGLVSTDPKTGEGKVLSLAEWLTPRQQVLCAIHPEFLHQLVELHAAEFASRTGHRPRVEVIHSAVSLNGTASAPLYRRDVDLAATHWSFLGHDGWVIGERGSSE